jgi:hypothetical protein
MILNLVCEKCGLDSTVSGQSKVAGFCELVGKRSVSIKGEKYYDEVIDCQIHNKSNAPWGWLVGHGY